MHILSQSNSSNDTLIAIENSIGLANDTNIHDIYRIFFICHRSVLRSNSNNVFLTGIGDPFLEHNIRYHCPIFCLLKFDNSAKSTLSQHIWLYDRCGFNSFCAEIQLTDWHILKHDNIDTYAENVTTCSTELAKKHIPNKTIICRPSDPPLLTTYIRKLIIKKKTTLQ